MAINSKAYPRATVKKIVKGHANKSLSRDVDALVYLDYVLFIQELMRKAAKKTRQAGEKRIAARDIRKVTMEPDYVTKVPRMKEVHKQETHHMDRSNATSALNQDLYPDHTDMRKSPEIGRASPAMPPGL